MQGLEEEALGWASEKDSWGSQKNISQPGESGGCHWEHRAQGQLHGSDPESRRQHTTTTLASNIPKSGAWTP